MNAWNDSYKSKQGNIGLGQAIAYYMSKGYIVLLPINDTQPYDLVVDKLDGNGLQRVSVKTTKSKGSKSPNFSVDLRSSGGNKSRYTNKLFDKNSCDILFVYTIDNNIWEFPSKEILVKSSISLCEDLYGQYKIQ